MNDEHKWPKVGPEAAGGGWQTSVLLKSVLWLLMELLTTQL